MSANLLNISRQISELIHDEDTDFDAPVKVLVNGVEYTVTDVNLEVNESDDTQAVYLPETVGINTPSAKWPS